MNTPENYKHKQLRSWGDFDNAAAYLINCFKTDKDSDFDIQYVIGISRGGVFLAGAIAYGLDKPMFTVNPKNNDEVHRMRILIKENPNKVLIVDDRYHTGRTLDELIPYTNQNAIAVWHKSKEFPINTIGYYFESVPKEDWIVYPWDKYVKGNV